MSGFSLVTLRWYHDGDGSDPATVDGDGPDLGIVGSNFIDDEGFDYSTDDSVEFEGGLVGDAEEDSGSDVHEEKPPTKDDPPEKKKGRGRPRNKHAAPNAPPPPTVHFSPIAPPTYPTLITPFDYPASSFAPPNYLMSW
ncbi:hypothetical protein HAX54_053364 [Datura stramonium]|uniref:Uncharacterized protein n=1 Tax=Datura stramonium TaxID=4076 RepID=A0ABS8WSF9_DATST|nr:hypothetical protein [Datura stramonium]